MPSIAEILMQQGRTRANLIRDQGENSARLWGGLGQIAQQGLQQYGQMTEQRRVNDAAKQEEDALRQLFSGDRLPDPRDIIEIVGPERGMKIAAGLKAFQIDPQGDYEKKQTILRDTLMGMDALPEANRSEYYPTVRQSMIQKGVLRPEDAPEQYDPQWWTSTLNYGKAPAKGETGFTLSPGQQRFGPDGKPIASVAAPAPEPRQAANPTEASLAAAAAAGDKNAAKALQLLRQQSASEGVERPSQWVQKDGESRFVTPSQAAELSRQGWKSGSTREQGRPVTSGDANRIAELDTSLNDLATLAGTLRETSDSTGYAAAAGAKVWAPITEITGWGMDAKKRQGVIDRVKQVIGKALEGGVLRKEDEYKYTKILPTILDPPELAASKLQGLQEALTKRRTTTLEALSDAGYDTSRFDAKGQAPAPAKPAADPLGLFK